MRRQFLTRVGSVRGWLAIWLMLSLILIPGCLPDGNKRPIAQISAKPTKGEVPLTVYFDGLDSYDPDGSIISYHWDFGDRVTCPPDCGSGDVITPTHQYMEAGTYRARLTVTDDKGAEDRDFVIIEVITPGVSPPEGQVLFFDDFEDGADPSWRPNPGSTWMVEDGRYTISKDSPRDLPMRTFVGSSSWQDYSVEVEVHRAYGHHQIAVLLRVQNDDDMVGFFVVERHPSGAYDYAEFRIKKDGVWREVGPRHSWGWYPPKNFVLLVTVEGNTFSASVNAEHLVTIEIPDAPARGYVGLQTARSLSRTTAFDNFKVTSLGQ